MNLFVFDTNKKLQIKLAGTVEANQLHWTAHGIINDSGTQTPVAYAGATNSTTDVDITSVPADGTQVIIKQVTVYNTDTSAATFYLILNDNATQYTIVEVLLHPGKWSMVTPAGVVADETDPIFTASAAYGITSGDIANWDAAYGWGDWSGEGFITGTDVPTNETDPLFSLWLAGDPRLSNWEVDGANGLKPKDGKTVDGDHISGTIYGGLFQP